MLESDLAWERVLPRVRDVAAAARTHDLVRVRVDAPAFAVEAARAVRRAHPPAPVAVATLLGDASRIESTPEHDGAVYVRADIVGIVRLSRPLVAVGMLVAEERELAYVESLGIRNPVRAKSGGRVVEIRVRDGDPVEYGQPLFALIPDPA